MRAVAFFVMIVGVAPSVRQVPPGSANLAVRLLVVQGGGSRGIAVERPLGAGRALRASSPIYKCPRGTRRARGRFLSRECSGVALGARPPRVGVVLSGDTVLARLQVVGAGLHPLPLRALARAGCAGGVHAGSGAKDVAGGRAVPGKRREAAVSFLESGGRLLG